MNEDHRAKRRKLTNIAGLTACLLPAIALGDTKTVKSDLQDIPQPADLGDSVFIDRAFNMRRKAVDIGDQAYGAIVVRDNRIIGQSPSHVLARQDPTAHAEMEAIRDAARRSGSRDLSGCTLYSSSRACPMCEAAAYWANIDRMVYGRLASDAGQPALC